MAGEMTPKAQEALSLVQLMQGEEVQYSIQADGFFLGSMPIQKMIAKLQSFVATMTGGHVRVFLIMTNMRLLMIESRQVFCGWQRVKGIHTIATSAIVEAGSSKETQMCCVHTRTVHIESKTQRYTLAIKKLNDEDVRAFVTHMSQLIIANSQKG